MRLQSHPTLLALTTALALAGCGGGSDSGSSPPPPKPVPTSIGISGQAAAASALGGRRVRALCRIGGGDADTDAVTGRYRVDIPGGAFPCVMRLQVAENQTLHSVATDGGSGTATANITPLTELTVAQLTGSSPATYFESGFAASSGSAVTAEAVASAGAQVLATLATGGVNASAAGNPVTAALVPAGTGTPDAHGQALAALDAALQTAGATLTTLVATVAQAAPAAATPTSSSPSLPAAQQLQAKAPNCSALRSGRYRAVFNGTNVTDVETIDAPALTGVNGSDGDTFTLPANGPCRYRFPGGGELVVSAGGVIIGQVDDAPYTGIVMFPEQSHGLSAIAGTVNFLGFDRVSNARPHLVSMTLTIAADGEVTRLEFCAAMLSGCATQAKGDAGFPSIRIVPNPTGGGFLLRNATEGYEDPLFVYTTGSGEKMYVMGSTDNGLSLGTRAVARPLPTVGAVSDSWNMTFQPNATAPFYTAPGAVSESKNTIFSTNPTAGSWVRDAVVNFSTGVTVPETVEGSVPRIGYSHRVPGPATASDGSARNVGEWVALGLLGTGVSAVGIVGNQNLILSVGKAE